MEQLYERVLELLGKNDDDPLFGQFVEDLGEKPFTLLKTKHSTEYMFTKSGLHLSFMEGPRSSPLSSVRGFQHAFFSLEKGYSGNLPSGIKTGDSPKEIERKLGIKPVFSDAVGLVQEYDQSPFKVSFSFSGCPEKLVMVSVVYSPAIAED